MRFIQPQEINKKKFYNVKKISLSLIINSVGRRKIVDLSFNAEKNFIKLLTRDIIFTCISGSIPFPNMAAMIEIEVNALKILEADESSRE